MQKSKQATLFRSWGGKKPLSDGNARYRGKGKAPARWSGKNPPCQDASAKNAPSTSYSSNNAVFVDLTEGEEFGFKDVQELDRFFEDDVTEEIGGERAAVAEPATSAHNSSVLEEVPGFDHAAGEQWIYPINYPVRDYQFNIVQKCLFRNTLVCLPTGLGKTFIAAVVMFNFYRWYPTGKVVFMAPTKPLVTQQIEACHNIMGIPQIHLAEMTGNLPPKERAAQWISKRVFFLTPQVMQNDITKGACPADLVRCVVFDEAHKALGNYSYCQVVKELSGRGVVFRVLALSATPGNDLKAVQQVVTNLQLSHIELRADDSFDIQPYTHQRKVELHVVPLEGEILLVKNTFLEVLSGVIGRLAKFGVVYSANPERLSKFGLLQARDGFRQCPPHGVRPGSIESDFATAISLYHAYDLLLLHGLRPFHHYLAHTFSNGSYPRAQQEVDRHPEMARHLRDLRRKLTASSSRVVGCGGVGRSPRSSHYTSPSQCSAPDLFYGHPKLRKLEEVVLEHFRRCGAQSADGTGGRGPNTETRVMVFSQYRESVQEIADLLSSHAPLVRVMSFVGHGTTGKSTSKGLTQREQTEVVRKFREGGYNTLVATCVGEEGLDIGEVDLIVCFDAHKSPIRLVQRMGRTGRKRSGRIVVIVTQGKEEQTYRKSQSNKHSIHKAIRQNSRSLNFFPHAPRMVPRHMTPQSLKQPMTVEEYKPSERGQRGRGRRQPRLSLGPPVLSRASQRGCLSHQELEEWSKRFSLPDRELRACERAVGECFRHQPILGLSHLKRGKRGVWDTPIDNRVNRNHSTTGTPLNASVVQKFPLSLSKWIRWQTGQTHFKMVGPSEKGKQFVSLLEFLDLMYSCDGLGESYATEMAAFFDPEDIRTVGAAASTEGVSTAGSGGEKGRGGRRARRRLASGSSDDDEFLDEGVGRGQSVGRGEQCSKPTTNEDVLVTEEMSPHLPDRHSPIPSVDDRDLPAALQHTIPRPPSCDSLDWLDDIQPSQISTPLPSRSSSTSANPHSPPHASRDFQFAFPHTPPSSRKSKTPFVTPLTTPPHRKPERNRQPVGDRETSTTNEVSAHFESMDLFNDISSAVLFDDFSDVGTSQTAQEQSVKAVQGEVEEKEVAVVEAGEGGSIDDALNITSIPESEDDGEEGEEIQENGDEKGGMEVHCDSQNGDVSEESLIGGCGQRRRKFARPDFLLTQAPPKSPPISPTASSGTAPGSGNDEDFLLEPLSRRLRKRGVFVERERESGEAGRKKVRLEPEEYLDKEAELSGEGEESGEEEEVERGADEYNMEDSFINDNSILTQVTPSQLPKEKLRSKKFSPVNMADVYRQSLMSPHSDHLFVGRRGGGGYRMVLSQRHQILNHCLAKAGGRRLFDGERRRGEEDVSSESGESEAEEVRVCYGEEDEKEIEDSQSIGEPWEWGEEEEESGGTRTHHPMLSGEDDIVSPSLLVSVEPQPTPSCYDLEVEGWLSESGSCWSDEDPTTASIIVD